MLGPAEFDFLSALVRERSAIVLDRGKEYLVESRILPLMAAHGFSSARDLCEAVRAAPRAALERSVVEAMTTNETSFFRDVHPFEALRNQILPALMARRQAERRLVCWSAACSSGQEIYSLAMLMAESFPALRNWEVTLLATDLSRAMVERTRRGRYSQIEVHRGLPASLLVKYFRRTGTEYEVVPELRRLVEAREFNLAAPWPPLPAFDLILLRNVMIYFNQETRRAILRRVRQALRPDGFLLLGSAEAATMMEEGWQRIRWGTSPMYSPLEGAADRPMEASA